MAQSDGQLRAGALALVAHDDKKAEMADFVAAHEAALRRFELYATGTTAFA